MPKKIDLLEIMGEEFNHYAEDISFTAKDTKHSQLSSWASSFVLSIGEIRNEYSDHHILSFLATLALRESGNPGFTHYIKSIILRYEKAHPEINLKNQAQKHQNIILEKLEQIDAIEQGGIKDIRLYQIQLDNLTAQMQGKKLNASLLMNYVNDARTQLKQLINRNQAMLPLVEQLSLLFNSINQKITRLDSSSVVSFAAMDICLETKFDDSLLPASLEPDFEQLESNDQQLELAKRTPVYSNENIDMSEMLESQLIKYMKQRGYSRYVSFQDSHYARLVTWFTALCKYSESQSEDCSALNRSILANMALQALLNEDSDPTFIPVVKWAVRQYEQSQPIAYSGLLKAIRESQALDLCAMNDHLLDIKTTKEKQKSEQTSFLLTQRNQLKDSHSQWAQLALALQQQYNTLTEKIADAEEALAQVQSLSDIGTSLKLMHEKLQGQESQAKIQSEPSLHLLETDSPAGSKPPPYQWPVPDFPPPPPPSSENDDAELNKIRLKRDLPPLPVESDQEDALVKELLKWPPPPPPSDDEPQLDNDSFKQPPPPPVMKSAPLPPVGDKNQRALFISSLFNRGAPVSANKKNAANRKDLLAAIRQGTTLKHVEKEEKEEKEEKVSEQAQPGDIMAQLRQALAHRNDVVHGRHDNTSKVL